ncbi:MAG: hypothetical protein FWG90_04570 [Oscillospiraceae bacterium]|nr:hypothetical protein [Oscillospiraceae bacterium]
MKKKIALLISLALCAAISSACGTSNNEPVPPAPTPANPIVTDGETAAEETEAETEPEADIPPVTAEAIEKFGVKRDLSAVWSYDFSALEEPDRIVESKDSLSFQFASELDLDKGFYLAGDFSDEGVDELYMAMQGDRIVVKAVSGGIEMLMHLNGNVLINYDPATRTATKMEIPEDQISNFINLDEIMNQYSQLGSLKAEDSQDINVFDITIDGANYTYEHQEDSGFVFDDRGQICKIISPDGVLNLFAFTTQVPQGAFDEPEGYEVIDLSDLASMFGDLS